MSHLSLSMLDVPNKLDEEENVEEVLSIYFPVIWLGILSIGAIVTAMNPLSSLLELQKQMIDCRVSFALTTPAKVKEMEKMGIKVVVVPENVNSFLNSPEFSSSNNVFLATVGKGFFGGGKGFSCGEVGKGISGGRRRKGVNWLSFRSGFW
ncbi:hypothetical protein NE237_014204 [Protea cynaroides]|uniref:4-coumarate--CoA ligase n=1 Tax=Protea cynaroides TaxID=273540 RepID=A0A9Q0GNI9_9MAGN|nr:hypothetical protein NE237_014204 [Protea cynaroides]